jgi:pyruvate-formate lyase-activating enzyme
MERTLLKVKILKKIEAERKPRADPPGLGHNAWMGRKHVSDPCLVAADAQGNLFDIPDLYALGRSGGIAVRPDPRSWRPLPQGSLLFHLPGRRPLGWDPRSGQPTTVDEHDGEPLCAAAAFLPPAHTLHYLSAWSREEGVPPLPLYAYCAVGFRDGQFVVPATRTDQDVRQDLAFFDEDEIQRGGEATLARFPGNRLVEHLIRNCAWTYCCPAARNFALGRYEAPLPTSPACNADCVGCISLQPEEEIPVTQPRLTVKPTADEIVEMSVEHLESAARPIVSFGQGCEGEPLLRAEVIEDAIRGIRRRTSRGVVNINTNASRPGVVERLVDAGLDSIRISLNSCRRELYERYYRPRGYGFDALAACGRAVSRSGGLVSLNYFVFPGVTDDEDEVAALDEMIETAGVHVLQLRNLNLDPDHYIARLGLPEDLKPGFGIERWMKRMRKAHPEVLQRYFNPPREDWPEERRRGVEPVPQPPGDA